MGWIDDEFCRLWSSDFADSFVRCGAAQRLEPSLEIIGCHEVAEMCPRRLMTVVKEVFNGCFHDCTVHPLNLPVRPRMIVFRQAIFDLVHSIDHVEAHGTWAISRIGNGQ